MKPKVKRWLPIVLCCLPGVALAVAVGLGVAAGGAVFGGLLGASLIALAALACPLSMGWMMMRSMRRSDATGQSTPTADCCMPGEQTSTLGSDPLVALHARREALEREVAELQAEAR